MTQFKRYTVTAALPYVNGPKHIGHLAGAYLPADIYVRYLRQKGLDVLFICGSDELGTPITIQALKENLSPKELIDKYHFLSKDCFDKLGISFDIYHRTSEKLHFETAQAFFLDFYNKGLFEEKITKQYYDKELDMFLADRYIKGTCPNCQSVKAFGDQCESCGKSLDPIDLIDPISVVTGNKPELKETKNWYLPLDHYEPWLREWLIEGKKSTWKSNTYGQSKSWIDGGLQPRSMTRDGQWGVPLPIDNTEGKILYVWFDAPIGYISASKQWALDSNKDWEPYWKSKDTKLVHFVGKDNIVFHCIIFPIMLHAHGDYILPEDVPANEFLNLEGEKMSTSRRWSLEMYEYLEAFPNKIDELRYCLISNLPENKDADFSWKDYQLKVNSELVAIVGNLTNRIFVLMQKFFGSTIPNARINTELASVIKEKKALVSSSLEVYHYREAMSEVMHVARIGNKLLTDKEPWKVYKDHPEEAGFVLYDCIQILANFAILVEPFLPNTAIKLKSRLRITQSVDWNDIGRMDLVPFQSIIDEPFHLFDKVEDETIQIQIDYLKNKLNNMSNEHTAPTEIENPSISFEEFSKMNLVIGTIVDAEKIANTDKLMKLTVNIGNETRTIVSGIALHFEIHELKDKSCLVVENLTPRKIKGIESKGMILFAEDNGKLQLVTSITNVANGAVVK